MFWLGCWIVLPVLVCGACSVLEASFLSVRMPSLYAQSARNAPGAKALLAIRRERPADAISAILLVNTLAGMVGATFAGAVAASLWGDGAVGWISLIMTVFMLFASEIGPKTYAATHADRLSEVTGRSLAVLLPALAPLLLVTRAFTQLLAGKESNGVTRHTLAATIAAAPLDGAITTPESELLTHVVYVHGVTIAEIVTPLPAVVMLAEGTGIADFVGDAQAAAFSRIPVYRGERTAILGYVAQRDVLRHLATGGSGETTIDRFIRPIPRLAATLTLREATDRLLRAREAIAVVESGGRTDGIVTLEDLLETLTGIEITDEAEDVAAQRPAAERARRQRIDALLARERQWAQGANDSDGLA